MDLSVDSLVETWENEGIEKAAVGPEQTGYLSARDERLNAFVCRTGIPPLQVRRERSVGSGDASGSHKSRKNV